jgi:hypothetical protein
VYYGFVIPKNKCVKKKKKRVVPASHRIEGVGENEDGWLFQQVNEIYSRTPYENVI